MSSNWDINFDGIIIELIELGKLLLASKKNNNNTRKI